MNILQVTKKKSVVYLCVLLYFVFLCVLFSQTNSSALVGFGFGFLWLMSVFTENIVLCVAGSFVLVCCLLVFFGRKEGFENNKERCNPTCFFENQTLTIKIGAQHDTIIQLNEDVGRLTTANNTLTGEKEKLETENTRLNSTIDGLNAQNNSLSLDKMNLTASKENYRMLVENISRHSTST
jgi:hypothetical protein